MNAIEIVERAQTRKRPAIKSGDTVRVHVKIREGDKERVQVFEGLVIALHRGGDAGIVHRAQGVVRARRGTDLSAALADHRADRRGANGAGATRQALLPPEALGQGGADARAEGVRIR